MARFVGIDVGAETIKAAELTGEEGGLRWTRRELVPHEKDPAGALLRLLGGWDWDRVAAAAVCGRLGRQVALPRVPAKQAQLRGYRLLQGDLPATVVSIGSHGFSVLEIREGGAQVFRENSRCAQGTGNFLRQLVERFGLDVEAACALAEPVEDPAPLSGRCPVILKSDMTHLANKGEQRDRILAGLLDAIAENVEVLVKPRQCPPRVLLAGGVSRSRRVREHFRRFLDRNGMALLDVEGDSPLFLEALGCAAVAAERDERAPPLSRLVRPPPEHSLERIPSLRGSLTRVRRMPHPPARPADGEPRDLVLGFDIGSTGSKVVALDGRRLTPVWEGYLRTGGDPVGAAQALMRQFLEGPAGAWPVRALGATGSGREIVGSLMATCYGPDAVFVLNEIAAHAQGALHHDPRVDTIFEIGGQDAKYIRLSGGRVVDAAMNEACSAGTGSFIEEQGRRFSGIENVVQLGEEALRADSGVALGQHCSIFMAEIIDEAVAAGVPRPCIVAGIYDSVVANYLNRVKGSRSVGQVVFCQGMPFAADALAAAVARQTGAEVIVPPNPGTVGALGIALLAAEELQPLERPALLPRRFLEARLEKKDTFVCNSAVGCGGAGNKCRIDRLTTVVEGARQKFTWGGGCSLYDKGTRKKKLPDRAPDPFRERAELVQELVERLSARRGGKTIALSDEFQLAGLFPFFATFFHGLGLDLEVTRGAGRAHLKNGIEAANVPFCAPMQQYHGLVAAMAEGVADAIFVPMLRELPRVKDERAAQLCPVVQGSPEILRWDLGPAVAKRLVSPAIDLGPGRLDGPAFLDACRRLAAEVAENGAWRQAWAEARAAQLEFDAKLLELGRRALDRCREHGIVPVVVLGRAYTIHNEVLNSNVPAILREQGAIAIPVDCYPVDDSAPLFPNMFWGYGQRILRAAWHIRRQPGVYSLFCSNYSCGPDSFTVHSYQHLMEGRPFAIIETDGHSGDAGTKTRVEAFLHCVREDVRAGAGRAPNSEDVLTVRSQTLPELRRTRERVLIPRMGPAAGALAAVLRGLGLPAEALPEPTRETLRIGRRHTSGKECLPMTVTAGSLLERLERERDGDQHFAFLMAGSDGPCRFGAYKELHQLVLDRLGWSDRVRIWSPPFGDYFQGVPAGAGALVLAGVVATDLLRDMLHEVRPAEARAGEADHVHRRFTAELEARLEREARGDLSGTRVLIEAATGRLYGVPEILGRAGRAMAAARGRRELPLVLVVGEIYVRNDPFANDFVVEQLERRGIRCHVAGVGEYLQYSDHMAGRLRRRTLAERLDSRVRRRIESACHQAAAEPMGWPEAAHVAEALEAARPYVRDSLETETVLTLGASLLGWRRRGLDAVVSTGPLECMPNKIAESQFFHAAEREGLLSLSLSLNGDPIDPEVLDNFAFEVHARFRKRGEPRPEPTWVEKLEDALPVVRAPAEE
ncbi:MAG TPA: BadF/BadG/BcrA/BcrD ATPase family protein [Anaeromyxobacteraceae bacterium]|nr:BadF/BadG/BcrA/BcrD ATPase family protein [Anaeromyxobacteraceae bacterium]